MYFQIKNTLTNNSHYTQRNPRNTLKTIVLKPGLARGWNQAGFKKKIGKSKTRGDPMIRLIR